MSTSPSTDLTAAIAYMEHHLHRHPTWEAAARAASYSPYHLHRAFTRAVGVTPHTYLRRRQLTEAARHLVFSAFPILDIALTAGYESQQAFSTAFKALYKQTPLEYRQSGHFYPLQLPFSPAPLSLPSPVVYAVPEDLDHWLPFLSQVIPGFPHLEKAQHMAQLHRHITHQQVLLVKDGPAIVGAVAFSPETGHIHFLASHPQCRQLGIDKALLDALTRDLFPHRSFSITTFRPGDKADTGQRAAYQRLGFTEGELLTQFGYPVQRLILPPHQERSRL